MATYALIHDAGDVGWHWHLLAAELRGRGHDVVAPDLPCDDDSAGLTEYADTVDAVIGHRRDLVVVAQSFGGFTAPLGCERRPVDLVVLLAGMVPSPGERPDDWPANTGWAPQAGPDGRFVKLLRSGGGSPSTSSRRSSRGAETEPAC